MRAPLALAALLGLLCMGTARADPDNFTEVERGRYLARAGDCVACHLGPDRQSLAGGHRLETPFGAIAVPNITPDAETGIGSWSADDFHRAMHKGVRPDGTHLYPAFPYTAFTRLSRQDNDAIYAYLRTLEPVRNAVDRDTLPFPFNIRALMGIWNRLNFTPGEFQPDPQRSEAYNRGAYLVEGPAHCGLCHTPRNLLGGDRDGQHLQGGVLQDWFAPNITADRRVGIGGWSDDEMVEYLRTGRNAHSAASGPMAEVVAFSTSQLSEADLRAIATYLRERGAAAEPAPAPLAAEEPRMRTGSAIYADSCAACHRGNGSGVDRMFPRLARSALVQQGDATSVIRMILEGGQAAATPLAPTAPAMPAFGWRMNDRQVADVATYLRNAWGNAAPPVTPEMVQKLRASLSGRGG